MSGEAVSSAMRSQDRRPVLVVGSGDLAAALARVLDDCDAESARLRAPSDRELRAALTRDLQAVVLVSRDDIEALRMALLVEHLRPGLRMIVTIFGRTVAAQLVRAIPDCRVISMADAAVPALVAACCDPRLQLVLLERNSLTAVAGNGRRPRVWHEPVPRSPAIPVRASRWLRSQLRPLDTGSRMLLLGALGLLVVLVADTAVAAIALEAGLVESFYGAVKTIATVGPNPLVDQGPSWFKVLSSMAIVAAAGFAVLFTAGLVNRVLEPRLTGIIGSRTIPRSRHVVVVGLGQVGLRLCLALRALSVPVVAIERDPDALNVRVANDRKVPVVIGEGAAAFCCAGCHCTGRVRWLP
ncbi:MAG: NAD-binding protein [Solirubrobacterales bacterium]